MQTIQMIIVCLDFNITSSSLIVVSSTSILVAIVFELINLISAPKRVILLPFFTINQIINNQ